MLDLFKHHPNGYQKLKNISKICVGKKMFGSKIQQLFYIEQKDKSREDISYMKSVSNLFEDKYLKHNLVSFKNEKF